MEKPSVNLCKDCRWRVLSYVQPGKSPCRLFPSWSLKLARSECSGKLFEAKPTKEAKLYVTLEAAIRLRSRLPT